MASQKTLDYSMGSLIVIGTIDLIPLLGTILSFGVAPFVFITEMIAGATLSTALIRAALAFIILLVPIPLIGTIFAGLMLLMRRR